MTRPNGDVRALIRAATAQGWTVQRTARGHFIFYPADRTVAPVTLCSSNDVRGYRNARAELRRHGLKID